MVTAPDILEVTHISCYIDCIGLGPRSRQSDGALGAASPQASAAMDSSLAWGPARPTADVRSCSLGWELAPRRRADTGELVGLFR